MADVRGEFKVSKIGRVFNSGITEVELLAGWSINADQDRASVLPPATISIRVVDGVADKKFALGKSFRVDFTALEE